MSARASALAKLQKAVRLHARATELALEAAAELSRIDEADEDVPPVTDLDKARAKRLRDALRRAGARIP